MKFTSHRTCEEDYALGYHSFVVNKVAKLPVSEIGTAVLWVIGNGYSQPCHPTNTGFLAAMLDENKVEPE